MDNGNVENPGDYLSLPGYGKQTQNVMPFNPLQQQYMQNNFQYQQIQNELPPSYEEFTKNKK